MKKHKLNKSIFEIHDDHESDIRWVVLGEGFVENTEEIAPGLSLEFDENQNVIGIEIHQFSRLIKLSTKNESATTKLTPLFRHTENTESNALFPYVFTASGSNTIQ